MSQFGRDIRRMGKRYLTPSLLYTTHTDDKRKTETELKHFKILPTAKLRIFI